MRRLVILTLAASSLWAQPSRETYRGPFDAWKQAEPDLERTAGDAGPDFKAQTERVSTAAAAYLKARQTFLAGQVRTDEQARWAGKPFTGSLLLGLRPEVLRQVSTSTEQLSSTITSFASVRDTAIQQVRQAMERERAALNALNDSLKARGTALRDLDIASEDAELMRAVVGQGLATASTGRARIAAHIDGELTAWNKYYATLAEGAMSTEAAPTTTGAAPPKPVVARISATGLPLSRYIGTWIFQDKKLFFGAQPESVELFVREENGKMSGAVVARFVLPAGSPGDPELTFTFEGLMQQTRNQTFPLRTAEGVGGNIELIPGTAFNLLEVNFQTEPSANKVRSANFVLLKR